jgi:hypothetical protein
LHRRRGWKSIIQKQKERNEHTANPTKITKKFLNTPNKQKNRQNKPENRKYIHKINENEKNQNKNNKEGDYNKKFCSENTILILFMTYVTIYIYSVCSMTVLAGMYVYKQGRVLLIDHNEQQ